MTFRSRLLLASLLLALLPLALFGVIARGEVTKRLEAQYSERVEGLVNVVRDELVRESERISDRLSQLSSVMASDAQLRLALLDRERADGVARPYLLDYAQRAMPLAGLDLLRIQSADGRVLSSGHFRNEYGVVDSALVETLARAGEEPVLAEVATPAGSMLTLTRSAQLGVGAQTYTLVGGTEVDREFLRRLAAGTGLDVSLVTGADHVDQPLARDVALPFVTPAGESVARLLVRASDAPLLELRAGLDRWLLSTAVLAALLAGILAVVAAAQLSRPLAALARRAGRIDLDRLDVSFPTERLDEVGDLSRVLNRVTGRLRASAVRLRDAERRATVGDMARQVHHDVRNGLIPIRNVVSHLSQVASESPDDLRDVFLQRQGTLESSVTYLQSLASNYARLSPSVERRPCDVNRIASEVVADAAVPADGRVRVESELTPALPPVLADPVALRRVLDNLVVNAIESLEERSGRVLVWTRPRPGEGGAASHVQLGVFDTGRGMTIEERAHMFDDFYTTKARGTGLGLSIVRRLVNDMGGRIEVESEPAKGTRFTVELPAAAAEPTTRATGSVPPGGAHHDAVGDADGAVLNPQRR